MRKDFLQDYEARENEELERYQNKIRNNSLSIDDRYPNLDRFKKASNPITVCDRTTYVLDQEPI